MIYREKFLQAAIAEAQKSLDQGGIPIGSVLVYQDQIIGRGHNQWIQKNSAILHAEMDAIESAGRLKPHVYRQCTIYSTLSPCSMCSGTIQLYQIPRVIIGENQNFKGPERLLIESGMVLEILNDDRCIEMMSSFIRDYSSLWFEDIGQEENI